MSDDVVFKKNKAEFQQVIKVVGVGSRYVLIPSHIFKYNDLSEGDLVNVTIEWDLSEADKTIESLKHEVEVHKEVIKKLEEELNFVKKEER